MSDPLESSAERAKRFYRENPFTAAAGQNPYAESQRGPTPGKAVSPASDRSSVYAAPVGAETPYQVQFETSEESRGGWLLALSLLGFAGAMLPWLSSNPVYLGLIGILPYCSLGATIPAITLAFRDLSAMASGSMERSTRGTTIAALWIGIVGTLTVVALLLKMLTDSGVINWRAIWPW